MGHSVSRSFGESVGHSGSFGESVGHSVSLVRSFCGSFGSVHHSVSLWVVQ